MIDLDTTVVIFSFADLRSLVKYILVKLFVLLVFGKFAMILFPLREMLLYMLCLRTVW